MGVVRCVGELAQRRRGAEAQRCRGAELQLLEVVRGRGDATRRRSGGYAIWWARRVSVEIDEFAPKSSASLQRCVCLRGVVGPNCVTAFDRSRIAATRVAAVHWWVPATRERKPATMSTSDYETLIRQLKTPTPTVIPNAVGSDVTVAVSSSVVLPTVKVSDSSASQSDTVPPESDFEAAPSTRSDVAQRLSGLPLEQRVVCAQTATCLAMSRWRAWTDLLLAESGHAEEWHDAPQLAVDLVQAWLDGVEPQPTQVAALGVALTRASRNATNRAHHLAEMNMFLSLPPLKDLMGDYEFPLDEADATLAMTGQQVRAANAAWAASRAAQSCRALLESLELTLRIAENEDAPLPPPSGNWPLTAVVTAAEATAQSAARERLVRRDRMPTVTDTEATFYRDWWPRCRNRLAFADAATATLLRGALA